MPSGEKGTLRLPTPDEGIAGCVKITHIQQIPFFFLPEKSRQKKNKKNLLKTCTIVQCQLQIIFL